MKPRAWLLFLPLLLAASPAPAPPPAPAPAPAASRGPARLLSLLRAVGPASCAWLAVTTPDAAPLTLATIPVACAGATVATNKAGDRALVQVPGSASESSFGATGYPKPAFPASAVAAGPAGLWTVQAFGSATALPPLPDGRLERAGFDEAGQPVALTLVALPKDVKMVKDTDKDGAEIQRFHYHDRPYEAQMSDGILALAFAYRLSAAGAWELIEDKPTTTAWDYALGVDALDTAKLWRAGTDAAREDWESQEVAPKVQEALRRKLKLDVPAVTKDSNDGFTRLRSRTRGRGDLLVWQVSAEFAHDTGLILFHGPGAKDFAPLALGFGAGDLVRLSFQGNFGLVTTAALGAHPRLIDLRSGKVLFSSDQDYGASFWQQTTM